MSAAEDDPPPPGPAESAPTRSWPGVAGRGLAVALLVAFAGWRVTLGVSLADDGHVVFHALRTARGAVPLVDEMNFQVLGSIWAVPFAWLWDHTVGTAGIVLASRVYYLVLCAGALAVVHRALRPTFGWVVALAAGLVPLLAPPYDLLETSYNTAPVLGSVVATAAAYAAVRDTSARWATVAAAGLAAGTFSAPSTAPGGMLFALAFAVTAPRGLRRPFLGTLAGLATAALLWVSLVPGWSAVGATLAVSTDSVGIEQRNLDKIMMVLDTYWARLVTPDPPGGIWTWLPALVVAVLATLALVVPLPGRVVAVRALLLGALPFAVVVPGIAGALRASDHLAVGSQGSVDLVVVVLLLLLPSSVWAVTRHRPDLVRLLVLTAPGGLLAAAAIAVVTSSAPTWGAPVSGLAGVATSVVLVWASAAQEALRRAGGWLCGALVVALAILLAVSPFRDPYPWQLDGRVGDGAFAGLATTAELVARLDEISALGQRWVRPGDRVLVYASPGSYLLVGGESLTNVTWLAPNASVNGETRRYLAARETWPDVVFVDAGVVYGRTQLRVLALTDDVGALLVSDYVVVEQADDARFLVLRRR